MKATLVVLFVLVHLSVFGQRSNFIGYHVKNIKYEDDTSVHIFMSMDTVKEISFLKTKKKAWRAVKTGTWKIKKFDPQEGCWVTFNFSDGSSEDVEFLPTYHSTFVDKYTLPDGYSLYMHHRSFTTMQGKNGLMGKIKDQVRMSKQL